MMNSTGSDSTGDKPNKVQKPKSRRRVAREFVVQGLYQWKVTAESADFIEQQLRESSDFKHVDEKHFSLALQGAIKNFEVLNEHIHPCLDRALHELSPVEFAILLLGAYELFYHPEIPYRAIINEAIELARTYGGIDGHKYVNGVLDKLAIKQRAVEVEAQKAEKK